jgi:hypothetical protein
MISGPVGLVGAFLMAAARPANAAILDRDGPLADKLDAFGTWRHHLGGDSSDSMTDNAARRTSR